MRDLAGRVALITGGASGIGRATAHALAAEGVKLVVADIDGGGADAVAADIGKAAVGLACDVAVPDAFERLRDAALDRFGRIDIVMNNVGVLTRGFPDQLPVEEWQRIIDINLMSVVRSNAVFLPLLLAQGSGHFVNTASFAGLYTYAYDRLPYAATKAAIVQISEGLALYLRPKGIGVTCLCPGPVRTNIASSLRSFGPPTETRGPGPMFALMEPEAVATQVVAAIRENRFMLPSDDRVTALLLERAEDWDGFLERQITS